MCTTLRSVLGRRGQTNSEPFWRGTSTKSARSSTPEEAENVKAMKLEAIWEPSPFPAELPAHRNVIAWPNRHFRSTPWIVPPSWLLETSPTSRARFALPKAVASQARRCCLARAAGPGRSASTGIGMDEPYVLAARDADGTSRSASLRRGWRSAHARTLARPWVESGFDRRISTALRTIHGYCRSQLE